MVKYLQIPKISAQDYVVDTKTVAPLFFTIGSHIKHVMQKLLRWFPW